MIQFFPDSGFDETNIALFNRKADQEMKEIRDFLIAHYKLTERDDTDFWRHCASMDIPDSLQNRLNLFAACGRVDRSDDAVFREEAWSQVLIGQGLIPRSYDPMVDVESADNVGEFVESVSGVIQSCLEQIPDHGEFVRSQCPAPPLV